MRAADRSLWQAAQRRAARHQPAMRKAILDALSNVRTTLTDAELRQYIDSHGLYRVFSDAQIDQPFMDAQVTLRDAVREDTEYFKKAIPGIEKQASNLVAFDILNPRVLDALKELDSQVFKGLKADIRETLRLAVENGLSEGKSYAAIGRDLRADIGLAPNQLKAVDNFERMLREGDREALSRALRDKRFDSVLTRTLGERTKEKLTDAQILRMTDRYRENFITFNAVVQARTAASDAMKLGQALSWDAAVEAGIVDGDRLFKRWVGVKDSRERPEHLAMEGETVPYDTEYSNGEMMPGESTYNCRCISIFFVR